MAYDALDGYDLYFGGGATGAPSNETWSFSGGVWTNLTPRLATAPAARIGAAMDYDAFYQVVLLYGGCTVSACPDNSTWYYTQSFGWTNLTPVLSPVSPPLAYASLGFSPDPVDNYSVLFGGCLDSSCATLSNLTYGFTGFGWVAIPVGPGPTARWGASMAFDPSLDALVLAGGCTTATVCTIGSYWTYTGFTWTDRTALWTSPPAPPARSMSVLTWDESGNRLLLFGGEEGPRNLADTWSLACGATSACLWTNITQTGGGVPSLVAAAAPSWSNASLGIMLFGGRILYPGLGGPVTWVYSNGTYILEPALSAAPLVPDVGAARAYVAVQSNPSGGTVGTGPADGYNATWWYGAQLSYGTTTNLAFPLPGRYVVCLALRDALGVDVLAEFSIEITGANDTVEGSALADAGVLVNLSVSTAFGGTPPYRYGWTFGDGTAANGSAVSHAWGVPGTYDVRVQVTDAVGAISWAYAVETVFPYPSLSTLTSQTTVDVGTAVAFDAWVTGGLSPFTIEWDFGDGGTGVSFALNHTFRSSGSVAVQATATDGLGVQAVTTIFLTIDPALALQLSASPNPTTPTAWVQFDAVVSGGSGSFQVIWSFGDGGNGSDGTALHAYRSVGLYTATAWVNDSVGGHAEGVVSVVVSTSQPGGTTSTGDGSLLLPLLLGAAAAVLALALALVLRRRRRGAG